MTLSQPLRTMSAVPSVFILRRPSCEPLSSRCEHFLAHLRPASIILSSGSFFRATAPCRPGQSIRFFRAHLTGSPLSNTLDLSGPFFLIGARHHSPRESSPYLCSTTTGFSLFTFLISSPSTVPFLRIPSFRTLRECFSHFQPQKCFVERAFTLLLER